MIDVLSRLTMDRTKLFVRAEHAETAEKAEIRLFANTSAIFVASARNGKGQEFLGKSGHAERTIHPWC